MAPASTQPKFKKPTATARSVSSRKQARATVAVGPASLPLAEVLAAIRTVDARDRCVGLVPLAAVRAALPDVPRDALDRALLALQSTFQIDLHIASNPWGLADHGAAGLTIDRGNGPLCAYYASPRAA